MIVFALELILISKTIIVFATVNRQMDDETPAEKKLRLNRERQRRWRARLSTESDRSQRAVERANESVEQKAKRRASDAKRRAERRVKNQPNNQEDDLLNAMEFVKINN